MPTMKASDLDPHQRAAVEDCSRVVAVIAGAGSGKTRVLIEHIAHLVEHEGANPEQICALTFTRAAAAEMSERLEKRGVKGAFCGTFHSLAATILREWPYHEFVANRTDQFTILSESDALTYLTQAALDAGVKLRKRNPWRMLEDRDVTIRYRDALRESDALTFDDLEVKLLALAESPEYRPQIARRWPYLIVDEYQDTNRAQHSIVTLWNCLHRFVVGDWRQAIYRFRGSRPENLYDWAADGTTSLHQLFRNYRSRLAVVRFANYVSDQMPSELNDPMEPIRPVLGTERVSWARASSPEVEAAAVKRSIEMNLGGIECPKQESVAVLARTWRQLEWVRAELDKAGMEYHLGRPDDPWESPQGQLLINLARVALTPGNDVAMTHAMTIAGASQMFIAGHTATAKAHRVRLSEVLSDIDCDPEAPDTAIADGLTSAIEAIGDNLGKHADVALLAGCEASGGHVPCQHLVDQVADWCWDRVVAEADTSVWDWLEWQSFRGVDPESRPRGRQPGITLSTIHGAKGLEWDVVHVVHCTDGQFPIGSAAKDEEQMAEELRLFYVAATRARESLYFSTVTYPILQGGHRCNRPWEPTRFLLDWLARRDVAARSENGNVVYVDFNTRTRHAGRD